MTLLETDRHRMGIQAWMNAMALGREDWFKGMAGTQTMWMRDKLAPLFNDYDHDRKDEIYGHVVSTHTSKSQHLPVVEFSNENMVVRYRDNFHNHIISVELSDHVKIPTILPQWHDLFKRDHVVLDCYAEGFDKSWVHGSYDADPHGKFTVELWSPKEGVWAFMWILTRAYPVK